MTRQADISGDGPGHLTPRPAESKMSPFIGAPRGSAYATITVLSRVVVHQSLRVFMILSGKPAPTFGVPLPERMLHVVRHPSPANSILQALATGGVCDDACAPGTGQAVHLCHRRPGQAPPRTRRETQLRGGDGTHL